MKVRSSFSIEISVIILTSIFLMATFFSHYIFNWKDITHSEREYIYFGMAWVGFAVILVTCIVWDELLFHVRLKKVEGDGVIFRNSPYKLMIQLMIYMGIPAIFTFIYLNYNVNHFYFTICAGACLIIPLVKTIGSGINNYNDFLKFTSKEIEYKNNKKRAVLPISEIVFLRLIKDKTLWTEKIEVIMKGDSFIIDLNEMELEEFFEAIEYYIDEHYSQLLKK